METITVRDAIPIITPIVINNVLLRLSVSPLIACLKFLKTLIKAFPVNWKAAFLYQKLFLHRG